MYRKIESSRGIRWMKDGKFVKASEVPEDIKQNYTDKEELKNKCLICGGSPDHRRTVLGMNLELCDEHYYSPRCSYGYLAGILIKKGLVSNGSN